MLAIKILFSIFAAFIITIFAKPELFQPIAEIGEFETVGLALATVGFGAALAFSILSSGNLQFFSCFVEKFRIKSQFLQNFAKQLFPFSINLLTSDFHFFYSEESLDLPTSVVFDNFGVHKVRNQFRIFAFFAHLFRSAHNFFVRTPLFCPHYLAIKEILRHPFLSILILNCGILLGACLYHNKLLLDFNIEITLFSDIFKLVSWNYTYSFRPLHFNLHNRSCVSGSENSTHF